MSKRRRDDMSLWQDREAVLLAFAVKQRASGGLCELVQSKILDRAIAPYQGPEL